MSKHHHHHDDECCYPMMYGMGGYGIGSYGAGHGGGYGYAGWGIRWIYALLVLIVIVLQFGRNLYPYGSGAYGGCSRELAADRDEIAVAAVGTGYGGLYDGYGFKDQLIDNSVIFIIVVFLLILCAGCWWGGYDGGGCGGF